MTTARSRLVDVDVTRWYHCISRCVRGINLLAEGANTGGLGSRKQWIENRLEELSRVFAVSVGGFSIMDNHLHVMVRLDPKIADGWTDEQVVRNWLTLYPPRNAKRQQMEVTQEVVDAKLQDTEWVAKARGRLKSLSWFMKCLKEPLARLVNIEEECAGAFWASRFKSIAILDQEALLSVCAYIDLNLVAAGMSPAPEVSPHTSVKLRVEHAEREGRIEDVAQAEQGSIAASGAARGLEESLWLVPIEDRRRLDSAREGMLEGFTLGMYLLLVEYTGRLLRDGKASISPELANVFERLQSSGEVWQQRLQQLNSGRLLGRVLSTSRERLEAAAAKFGMRHLSNLAGCAVT